MPAGTGRAGATPHMNPPWWAWLSLAAVALTLRHHPNVNASWGEEAITQHGEVHIGVAVATPEGLITPVIRDADSKSVLDIAAERPAAVIMGGGKNASWPAPSTCTGSTVASCGSLRTISIATSRLAAPFTPSA